MKGAMALQKVQHWASSVEISATYTAFNGYAHGCFTLCVLQSGHTGLHDIYQIGANVI